MYKKEFNIVGHLAHTLSSAYIGIFDNGWTVDGEIHEDYYKWVNEFTASKGNMKVWGDFEHIVYATSKKAFDEFVSLFPPESWDYFDI
jgi:hypothetical protein